MGIPADSAASLDSSIQFRTEKIFSDCNTF